MKSILKAIADGTLPKEGVFINWEDERCAFLRRDEAEDGHVSWTDDDGIYYFHGDEGILDEFTHLVTKEVV